MRTLIRCPWWLVAVLTTLAADAAEPPPIKIRPVARTDTNSLLAHEQLLHKARTGRIDTYFLGDSITRRWGTSDPQYRALFNNWTTNFFGWNAANFGWGADSIENILWRISNGELDDVHPKIIVLLAGTNDAGSGSDEPRKAERIAAGIKTLLDVCLQKAPAATIVVMAIFPRNDKLSLMPVINEANRRIAELADGKKVRFLDINRQLADEQGILFEGMMTPDKLHPALKTYQIWADALKPVFRDILGPPAATDLAPPPTGDPSAKAR